MAPLHSVMCQSLEPHFIDLHRDRTEAVEYNSDQHREGSISDQ